LETPAIIANQVVSLAKTGAQISVKNIASAVREKISTFVASLTPNFAPAVA